MANRGIAVDLGTSKITVCSNYNGRVKRFQLYGLSEDYPCCVYYNNNVLYGEDARLKGQKDPEYCFKHLKTLLGRFYSDEVVQRMKDLVSYKIVPGENDHVMVKVCENDQIICKSPCELLSMLLNHVIEFVKRSMENEQIDYLALAYPPSFTDNQKRELKRIGILTGIRHISLYAETTAACIIYGISYIAPGQTVMVVDCGAGTCDATILQYDNDFKVVRHAGLSTVGGDSYTQVLMEHLLKFSKKDTTIERMTSMKRAKLEDVAENAKIALRSQDIFDIDIKGFSPVVLTEKILSHLYKDLNKKICDTVKPEILCQKSGNGKFCHK